MPETSRTAWTWRWCWHRCGTRTLSCTCGRSWGWCREGAMKKATRQELLDLAADVKKAAWLEFYLGHGDRAPDGTRLTKRGKAMIASALKFQADNDETKKVRVLRRAR